MFSKLTAFASIALSAAIPVAQPDPTPSVPADFLGSDHRYVVSVEEEFASLSSWDKQLGEWVGTAPGAFNDANSEIGGKNDKFLRLMAKDESGFFPTGVDATCDCGFKEISTGIVVSKQMYKYGLFEIEASMPDASLLSSFWLQGMNGEINIADVSNTASDGKTVSHNYHCFEMGTDGSSTTAGDAYNHMVNIGEADFDVTAYHKYGIHWDETGVTYFIDGEQVGDKLSAGCLDEEMNVVLSMETIATDVPENFGSHAMKVKSFHHYTVEETTTTTTTTAEPTAETVCDGDHFKVEKKFKAGDVCASAKPQGKCYKKIKHADAEEQCAAVGARMCTVEEIKGNVARTLAKSQCKVHGKPVWTSTECTTAAGNPGIFVTRGDGKNAKKDDCVDTTAKKFVRTKKSLVCCADVGAEMGDGDGAPSTGQVANSASAGASRQGQINFASTGGSTGDSDGNYGGDSSGGSAAAAAVGGLICVVAILGVVAHRKRQTDAANAAGAGAGAGAGADRRDSVMSVETEGRRYSAVQHLSEAPASVSMMEPMAMMTHPHPHPTSGPGSQTSTGVSDLETDNGFVLDAAGSLRVASVKRGNPMYRNSVYVGDEDEIGAAGVEEMSEM